jgi:di/tricarboxylate transporter
MLSITPRHEFVETGDLVLGDAAEDVGQPCLRILVAASAAYSTPVSTPVVTLVVAPGSYKFGDFIKIGVPLLVLTWIATLLVAPLVFPFA